MKLIGTFLIAMLALFFVGSVFASPCDQEIYDDAGFIKGNLALLQQQIDELKEKGVEVRVITLRDCGRSGDSALDEWEQDFISKCSSLHESDGRRKDTLVEVVLSLKPRKIGIYYGKTWELQLSSTWESVVDNAIVPRLPKGGDDMERAIADGKFTQAFTAGLKSIEHLISAPVVPAPSERTERVVQKEPTDYSGLWTALLVLFLLVGCSVAGYFIWKAVAAANKRRAESRAAQQRAQAEKNACSSSIIAIDEPFTMAEIRLNDLVIKASSEDVKELQGMFSQISQVKSEVSIAFAGLAESSANNPDNPGLSAEEYAGMEGAYLPLKEKAEGARSSLAGLDRRLTAAIRQMAEVPGRIAAAAGLLQEVEGQIKDVGATGFRTAEADELFAAAIQCIGLAASAVAKKEFSKADGLAKDAVNGANAALAKARGIVARKAAINQACSALLQRIDEKEKQIVDGREAFEFISGRYNPDTWTVVTGNGTEANKRVASAKEAHGKIVLFATMESQEWTKAEEGLGVANKWLDESDSYMRSILDLKGHLIEAEKNAQPEIDAAAADIKKAWDYNNQFDDDIHEGVKSDLHGAEAALDQARQELTHSKPNFINVVKLALAANATADRALAEAMSEHEAMEKKRARRVTLDREAERSISAAANFIEDHPGDVSSAPGNMLASAKQSLAQGRRATELDEQLRHLDNSDTEADNALATAQWEFNAAEAERERRRAEARRREEARLAAIHAEERRQEEAREEARRAERRRQSTDWGGGGHGGGGSSSWGGGSGGGGGSKGW